MLIPPLLEEHQKESIQIIDQAENIHPNWYEWH